MKQIDFVDLPPQAVDVVQKKTAKRPAKQNTDVSASPVEAASTPTIKVARKRGRPAKERPAKENTARSAAATKSQPSAAREGYRRLTADIPVTLHKQLKMRALEDDCTVTDLIIEAAETLLASRS